MSHHNNFRFMLRGAAVQLRQAFGLGTVWFECHRCRRVTFEALLCMIII
jgi:hypothetical protein